MKSVSLYRRWQRFGLLCSMPLWLGACSLLPFQQQAELVLPNLPATWSGDVSCPGCMPHQQVLTLFADGSFHLRDEYPASQRRRDKEVFFDVGRWSSLSGDESRVILRGGSEALRQFRLLDDGNLRVLEASGAEIRSIRDYILARETGLDPISGPMRLLGQLSIRDKRAHFQECLTGRDMAVLEDLPASVIKQFYVAKNLQSAEANQSVLASVLASFAARLPSAEESQSNGPIWQLDIQQVRRFWPGETCAMGAGAAGLPLRETPWRVISLEGEPIKADPLAPPLALRLHGDGQVSGHTGCNSLRTRFQSDDSALKFNAVVMTRRACMSADGQTLEAAWLDALRRTTAYRVVGGYLELLAGDRVLARLVTNEMH